MEDSGFIPTCADKRLWRQYRRVPRRSLFIALAATFELLRRGNDTLAASASENSPTDYCYWQAEDKYACLPDGTKERQWCFICNDPGTGWYIVSCEWRPDGSC